MSTAPLARLGMRLIRVAFSWRGKSGTMSSLKKTAFSPPGSTTMAAGPRSSGRTITSSVSPATPARSSPCSPTLRFGFNSSTLRG